MVMTLPYHVRSRCGGYLERVYVSLGVEECVTRRVIIRRATVSFEFFAVIAAKECTA